MAGSLLRHRHVIGHGLAARLQDFLERALVVARLRQLRRGKVRRELAGHEPRGRFQPAVEVERGDQGFVRVRPKGRLLAAARLLLSAPQ